MSRVAGGRRCPPEPVSKRMGRSPTRSGAVMFQLDAGGMTASLRGGAGAPTNAVSAAGILMGDEFRLRHQRRRVSPCFRGGLVCADHHSNL